MNKKLIIFFSIIIFVFGFTIYEAMKLDQKFGDNSSSVTGTVIKKFPNVDFTDLHSKKKITLNTFFNKNEIIVIHFWATWCGPCEAEFPELVKMIHLLKENKKLRFILVAVNDQKPKMLKFLSKFDLNLDSITLLEDKTNSHKQFGTYKMPETFTFSSEGQIIKKFTGQKKWTELSHITFFNSL
jgi:cytochrome c biogenesis protein CcmG/thiol:disulfide interchange protein DsbE